MLAPDRLEGKPMIAALRNADFRICQKCVESLPIKQFRLRRRDGEHRHTKCRRCHAEDERDRRRRRQAEKNGDRIAKLVTQMKNSPDVRRLAYLAELMFDMFGGVEGAAIEWWKQVGHCLASNAGGKRALDSFLAMRMLSEAGRPKPVELDEYTTHEDVERALSESILDLIDDSPEQVVEILRMRGYVVIPPPEFPAEPESDDVDHGPIVAAAS